MKNFLFFSILFFITVKSLALELHFDKSCFKGEKFNFRIDSFVDARMNQALEIGFTHIGLKNEVEKMTLPENFGNYCNNFFTQNAIIFSGERRFKIVIRQVTAQELLIQGNEYSDCSVSLDCYEFDPVNKSYVLFYQSYRKSVSGPVIDATGKHSKNLSNAFLVSLTGLSEFIGAKSPPSKIVNPKTRSEADNLLNLKSLVGARDTLLQDGIYYSSWQLLSNQPADLKTLSGQVDLERMENYLDDESFSAYAPCYAFVKNGKLYTCVRKNVYHHSEIVFATKRLRVLDVYNKKSSIRDQGYFYAFGFFGVLAQLTLTNLGQNKAVDLIVDLQTGIISR